MPITVFGLSTEHPWSGGHLQRGSSAELVRIVSEAVYNAMVDVANVPPHDKFQVINRHEVDEMVWDISVCITPAISSLSR